MIRFRQFIVASLAAGLALSVNAAGQTTEGTALLLSKARSLEARGRMDLAVQNWNQVLLLEPDQADALAGLARSAKQEGDLQGMRMLLDRLRKVNPKDPNIVAIEKMHVPSPTEIKKLLDAGRLATGQKFDEAMAIYRQVFGDAPPPGKWAESFYNTEASSTGGREKAIADLRALAARDPANEVYRLWLARVLTYSPQTRMEGFHLLEAIHDPGTMEQARAIWRQALVWEKDNPPRRRRSRRTCSVTPTRICKRASRICASGKIVRAVTRPNNRRFRRCKATTSIRLRQRSRGCCGARRTTRTRLQGSDSSDLSQKRFDEALTLFERARTLAPRRPEDVAEGAQTARFWRAMERGRALAPNDPADAIAAYEMALAVRPQDEGPVLGIRQMIATYVERRDLDRALTAVRAMSPRAFDAAAKHPDFLNTAALSIRQTGSVPRRKLF
jgi:tetratricopeptide (TPR) repeat protein